jgi:hypothetical protein
MAYQVKNNKPREVAIRGLTPKTVPAFRREETQSPQSSWSPAHSYVDCLELCFSWLARLQSHSQPDGLLPKMETQETFPHLLHASNATKMATSFHKLVFPKAPGFLYSLYTLKK